MKLQRSWFVLAGLIAFPTFTFADEVAPGVEQVGVIQSPDIAESSGIIPARKTRGAFWTHNDGGLDYIYAIKDSGESLGKWKIKDVDLQNIEDIAAGPGRLYIADIGNNTGDRNRVTVVQVPEPPANQSGDLTPTRIWSLKYPGDAFDSESFFVLKSSGYLISKDLNNGEARVYRFPLNKKGAEFELEKLCKLDVNAKARGADITPDGKRLAVITGEGAYLFTFDKTIPADGTIEPTLFVPFNHDSMEGCCFTAGGLLVTSESRDLYLFTDPQFKLGTKGGTKKHRR